MRELNVNRNTRNVYALTGIMTLCSYIVLPFLAIYFTEKNLSVAQVGIILGTSAFVSSFCGIFSPYFEKKFGIKKSILCAVMIVGSCYFVLPVSNNYFIILCIIILQGVGQGIVNPLLKKMVALYNKGNENVAFRYRYIVLCVAIIIGPVIGNTIHALGVDWMLRIVAFGCMISCVSLQGISNSEDTSSEGLKKCHSYKINISIVLFVTWSILVFTVFSVFENVSPLAIQIYNSNAEKMFSIMIIVNSIFAIIFQPIIIILNDKLSVKQQVIVGSMSFAISYIIFAYAEGEFWTLILATLVFTVGEAMLIPMLDVLIGKIAEEEHLAGVYAISEIKQIGFFIGPVVTTYFIQMYDSIIMYLIVSLICILTMFMSLILLKLIK